MPHSSIFIRNHSEFIYTLDKLAVFTLAFLNSTKTSKFFNQETNEYIYPGKSRQFDMSITEIDILDFLSHSTEIKHIWEHFQKGHIRSDMNHAEASEAGLENYFTMMSFIKNEEAEAVIKCADAWRHYMYDKIEPSENESNNK